ncbi:MAG TPA: ABC transporter ATP-binding protein [Pseudonocardiaceae bacterium]|jgi:ATP-binding cassette subfamily B protein|nr:ABC transporter ATP-binding protein [Pseudonocardiaceae bacterium]
MTAARTGRWRAAAAAWSIGWRASRSATVCTVVLSVLLAAIPTASAWLGKLLFDELARGASADVGRIVRLAVALAAGIACLAGAGMARVYCAAVLRARAVIEAEDRLIGAIAAAPGLRLLESPAFLDQVRLAEQGAQTAPAAVLDFGQGVVRAIVAVVGFGGAILVVWPPMVLLLAASLLPIAASQLTLSRLWVRESEAVMATHRERFLFRSLSSDVRAAKEIRLFGLAELFRNRMLAAVRAATASECAIQRKIAITGIAMAVLSAATSAAALIIAGTKVARGELSIGDVTLFTSAVAGVESATGSVLGQLGNTSAALGLFRNYEAVVRSSTDLPLGSLAVPPLRVGIELRDVWFRYDEDGPWVLKGVDLTIPKGAAVGLVGENGAGKSTLVKLMCRFYDPVRGQITWDGTDIRELDIEALRRRIGATFQDFTSYDLTAMENIGIGDLDRLTDVDRIRAAARIAEIDDTLAGLPRGYRTLLSRAFFDVDDHVGAALSGGQWQRVALARSLMRDQADLLILDEPSSGMDAAAEYRVNRSLRAHRAGRTSLLISHRLSALRDADLIVVLDDGRVVERGTHDELTNAGGRYARLFAMQASGYVAHRTLVESE